MNRIARAAVVVLAVAGAVAPVPPLMAQGDSRPTVAIMFFNNNVFTKDARDYDGLSKGIADFLITEMATNVNIRLIERSNCHDRICRTTHRPPPGRSPDDG